MDKTVYYLIATIVSSFAALISAINITILIFDRICRVNVSGFFVKGSDDATLISPKAINDFDDLSKYRAAIYINNLSARPCGIEKIYAKTNKSFFKKNNHYLELDGEFSDKDNPHVINGYGVIIYSFNPSVLRKYEKIIVVIKLNNGKKKILRRNDFGMP